MTTNPNYEITMREGRWTVGRTTEGRPFALAATTREFALAVGEIGQHEETMMLAVAGAARPAFAWHGDNLIIDDVEEILDRYLAAVVIA